MATIHLIRHGQASFGANDYDRLSETGWKQGRVLGRWLSGKAHPVVVFGGDMRRHRETTEAMATAWVEMPAMQVMTGFSEFDHASVLQCLKPEWADTTTMAWDLAACPKPARAFQEIFAQAVQRWASGHFDAEYSESWPAFKARVLSALESSLELAAGGDLLVSTSGGPIAVIAQSLLELSDRKALALNEVLANGGITSVLYSGSRRSLAVFNNYSHLEAEDPALVTFR